MSTGLGLRPWYLQGFNPVTPIAGVAPAPIAAAPEGALPPMAEAPSCKPLTVSILPPQLMVPSAVCDIEEDLYLMSGCASRCQIP